MRVPFATSSVHDQHQTCKQSQRSASLALEHCTITGNEARGGGIYFNGANGANFTLKNSTISGNDSLGPGGVGDGLFIKAVAGAVKIYDSQLQANKSHGANSDGGGAFVYVDGSTLNVSRTIIADNKSLGVEANVGGLGVNAKNGATVTLDAIQVIGNHADDDIGGLIIENDKSNITLTRSTISGNTAAHTGGAADSTAGAQIRAFQSASALAPTKTTIEYSTISNNTILPPEGSQDVADVRGGGLFIRTNLFTETSIRNSTISGNKAQGNGGGIQIQGDTANGKVEFKHSTVTKNHANFDANGVGAGGGIHITGATTDVSLDHTIVAENYNGADTTMYDDINGAVNAGWSLIGISTGATITVVPGSTNLGGTSTFTNPMLSPLGDHGGPTQTHAPLAGSPAIDAGNPAIGFDPAKFDQRGPGFARVRDVPGVNGLSPRIDIGAYEVGLARVIDVRLGNSAWDRGSFSFAEIVPTGRQLAPIFTQNVNQLQVVFSEAVNVQKAHLTLYGSNGRVVTPLSTPDGFIYDANTRTATWKFNTADLTADKYRLEISTAATDLAGKPLDGEWMNLTSGTPDNFLDDPSGRTFSTGDGIPGSTNNRFEFWFSLLPGDRNQDGLVNNSDLSASGDVNGDGSSNSADTTLVQNIINANTAVSLPVRNRLVNYILRGDYDDNEGVGPRDYAKWRATFGSTSDLAADGSGNGVVDAADYSPWRDNLGKYSAWYTGPLPPSGGGSGVPVFDPDNFPRVANVTISGSNSVHDPYSFDAHDSSGEQLRTVPVGGADTIAITFTEDVNITADRLTLTGMRTANRPTLADFSYNMLSMTATWRFTGWTFGDQYVISLSDAVTDIEGNRLDGEWTNPVSLTTVNAAVSEFPSGNGYAGGNFNFVATLLPGDANLDLIVNSTDYSIWSSHYGATDLFSEGDFDGSGNVDTTDILLYYAHLSDNLTTLSLVADLDGNWQVDDDDLDIFAAHVGMPSPAHSDGDLDGDNDVDSSDLDLMFAQYGLELAVVS